MEKDGLDEKISWHHHGPHGAKSSFDTVLQPYDWLLNPLEWNTIRSNMTTLLPHTNRKLPLFALWSCEDKRCNEGEEQENWLRGVNDRPGSRRATACKKGVHGGEVEAEPGADSDRVGCCWGVVVVASQELLPQEGHHIAKLDIALVK